MKNKSASQSVLTGLFVILASAICNSSAIADSTTWIATKSNWFTESNGVPNSFKEGSINNGGNAKIDNVATARSLMLGDNQGSSGTVVVDGFLHFLKVLPDCDTVLGDIYVGNRGRGTLYITNQATIWNAHAYIAAAVNPTQPASNGTVNMSNGSMWQLFNDCPHGDAGLFIGCKADTNSGGTALVQLGTGATISVLNSNDVLQAVKVGTSGTLTGGGNLEMSGSASSSKTAAVYGTLAPVGALTILGNLDLGISANTVFNVTSPQAFDRVYVTGDQQLGGIATLGGRISVTVTGNFSSNTSLPLLHAQVGIEPNTFFDNESINTPPCLMGSIRYDANNVYLDLSYVCEELP